VDTLGEPPVFEVYRARAATRGATDAEETLFGTARLATLDRVLRRDGARAALEEITVPEALIPALDEDAAPDLTTLLADAGLAPATIEDSIGAAVTTMAQSVALSCDRHTALLVLTRTARDAHGHALARQTLRAIAGDLDYRA
jgi:GntR family transcriptional regulator